jgi:hypothetical protein
VKKCVSCGKELPDTAMHCVFCGTKQPAAPAPAAGPNPGGPQAKTVLGYSAADLLKQAGVKPAAPPQPAAPFQPQPGPTPAQVAGTAATALAMQPPAPLAPQAAPAPFQPPAPAFPQPGPAASNNAGQAAHAATVFGGAPPASASPFPAPAPASFAPPAMQPQGFQPQGPGPSFGPALPGPIPPGAATMPPPSNPAFGPPQGGQFGGSAATAATMFMAQGPSPQAPQAAPAPFAQPYQPPQAQPYQPPQAQPYQPPQAQPYQPPAYQPPAYQPPQAQPYQPPGMAGYNPVPVGAAAQPPFLASQTAARLGRPVEPFYESVRLVLLAFGALLVIAFVTPVSTEPLAFHWNAIASAPGKAKIQPLLIAAAGVLGILMSLIPLAYVGRAALAAVIGLIPLVLGLALGAAFDWREALSLVASIAVVAGLFVRNEYRNDLLPRVLVTAGVVLGLVPLLVPIAGQIPLVLALKGIGGAPTAAAKIGVVLQLMSVLLGLLALIAWLPGPGTAGAKVLAWVILLFPILHHLVDLVLAGGIGASIKASPFTALLAPLPGVAYLAMATIGVAAIVGKQLESR